MSLNRRQLIKHTLSGTGLGILGREVVRPVGGKIYDIITGEGWRLDIDDIVHGTGKKFLPKETHEALVKSIAEALGAPEKNIHALLTQERPSGQRTDFFVGNEFGQDSGKPSILFERHTFWQALESQGEVIGIKGQDNLPTLLYRTEGHDGSLLSQKGYGSSGQFKYGLYSEQYQKLRTVFDWGKKHANSLSQQTGIAAHKIQETIENAALMGCSWGGGQILGNNYADLGYDSVRELVTNSSTVSGMTENFVRFIKHHKGIRVNGKHYTYLSEIRKLNPNWKIISMCHNGSSVASVNPHYIPNVAEYSAKYGTKVFPDGFLLDATAGAIAGASLVGGINLLKEKSPKKLARKIPKMTRKKFLEILRNGALGAIGIRTLSKINGLLGIDWKMPNWEQSKKTTGKSPEIYAAFGNPAPLRAAQTPTRIQTNILNPWLAQNKGIVKRYENVDTAQNDKEIVHIKPETRTYRCDGLGSQLLHTLRERADGNSQEYLYIHEKALEEITDISQELCKKAQKQLGMKEGYSLRVVITSALRDGAYNKKFLPNSSPNSTHNTGRAFDIAERFDLITPEGKNIEIDSKAGIIWSSLRALLIEVLNQKNTETIYYMREGTPPHFHCVAIRGTKKVVTQ